ncbi:MAG: glutamine-hydrolyzing carbamoyl-phosphate synthase small subunit [Holosporales bacterium]|jgi:carbamoyl-phosphate synthase small subunit
MARTAPVKIPRNATGVVLFPDGTTLFGIGFGRGGVAAGEICFNTAMTGYQEILTDPSFAGQIITFTFPHIGNVGANTPDNECFPAAAKGLLVREAPTAPSNYRAEMSLATFADRHQLVGIAGLDTRALTRRIRTQGASNVAVGYFPDGVMNLELLRHTLEQAPSMQGLDIISKVTCPARHPFDRGRYSLEQAAFTKAPVPSAGHVIAYDFGIKENILRSLVSVGLRVTVVPASTPAADVLAMKPDGVFLSNGPGDPAVVASWMVPEIQKIISSGLPLFGICLGFQLLAIALGAKTFKLAQGHRGANHPVQDLRTKAVLITSQNHGFAVEAANLPDSVDVTHISLFDGTLEGFAHRSKPLWAVQYHPEASPGPQEGYVFFEKFREAVASGRRAA